MFRNSFKKAMEVTRSSLPRRTFLMRSKTRNAQLFTSTDRPLIDARFLTSIWIWLPQSIWRRDLSSSMPKRPHFYVKDWISKWFPHSYSLSMEKLRYRGVGSFCLGSFCQALYLFATYWIFLPPKCGLKFHWIFLPPWKLLKFCSMGRFWDLESSFTILKPPWKRKILTFFVTKSWQKSFWLELPS